MNMNRRRFLRGAGGFGLALPFLPSLMTKEVLAQVNDGPPNFVGMYTDHGGLWEQNLYPQLPIAETRNYRGHEVRRSTLSSTVEDGVRMVSPVLSAPIAAFPERLVQKMSVIRGFDLSVNPGHGDGFAFGNYGGNLGNNDQTDEMRRHQNPSIDQYMAWSSAIYPNLDGILERTLHMGRSISYGYSNPAERRGAIEKIDGTRNPQSAFEKIFVSPEETASRRQPVADRVLELYRHLRTHEPRLSSADRERLDQHMERLHELDRSLTVVVSCGDVEAPADLETGDSIQGLRNLASLYAEVAVAALICGTSRIVMIGKIGNFSERPELNWHHEIAHETARRQDRQALMVSAKRHYFQSLFIELARRLDEVEMPTGESLLDQSLLAWHQEAGVSVHGGLQYPAVLAGSAKGRLRTGQYLDFRDLGSLHRSNNRANLEDRYRGLLWNQYLASIMQAMGVPRSEWESEATGFGHYYWPNSNRYPNASSISSSMSDPIPWLLT